MSNITTRRKGEIIQKLFEVLIEHSDGIQAKEALLLTEKRLKLNEHEMGTYESGIRRFDKIARFATICPVKAGWMLKNKGIWSITIDGEAALKTHADPEALFKEAVKLYRQWAEDQPPEDTIPEETSDVAEARITFEEAEEQAWREIGNYLEKINPYDLQELVAALLEAMEYHITWVAPPGKDGGIDLIAYTDPLGTKPPRIKVQVKRRKDNIGVEELRAFLALINQDDVGIYITTGGFSKDAQDLARNQETRKITLIDRQQLVVLWIENIDKIDNEYFKLLPLEPIYFLSPQD